MKLCSLFIYSSDIEEGAIVFRLIADLAGVLVHDNRNALDVGDFLAISVIEDGKCLHEDIFDSEKVTGHVVFSFALALNREIQKTEVARFQNSYPLSLDAASPQVNHFKLSQSYEPHLIQIN